MAHNSLCIWLSNGRNYKKTWLKLRSKNVRVYPVSWYFIYGIFFYHFWKENFIFYAERMRSFNYSTASRSKYSCNDSLYLRVEVLLPGTVISFKFCSVNQKSIPIVLGLNVASWFVGLFATYYVNLYLFTVVSALNIALGVVIIIFHVMGNPKVCGAGYCISANNSLLGFILHVVVFKIDNFHIFTYHNLVKFAMLAFITIFSLISNSIV